jgi:MFS family permease
MGALVERDFRLLFSATLITTVGDRLATIALAFAVLDLGSATDLGIVLGARQGVNALVLVFGGVISDRLPRNRVLVGASLVQGVAQAATAAFVLAGTHRLLWLVVFQGFYGVGDGLVLPAEVGLLPQTVSPARLQEANALQGLAQNVVRVLGPAVGATIVVAATPGIALLVRRASVGPHASRSGARSAAAGGSSAPGPGSGPRSASSGSATSRSRRGACSGLRSRRQTSEARARGERSSRRVGSDRSQAAC